MSALDTAKEIVRIGSTAGLSKDVIDLLEKKAALLGEQVAALEQENADLLRENRNLKLENESLKNQLPYAKPKEERGEQTTEILKYFFNVPGNSHVTVPAIMQRFNLVENVAKYHLEHLYQKDLIEIPYVAIGSGRPISYKITGKGRAYCVENRLVS